MRNIVLAALLAVASTAASAEDGDRGKRYAVLIGIQDYAQWGALVNPVPDVHALGQRLADRYGFLVEVLENPDRVAILATLRRYAGKSYGPSDQLVIAFAGHGNYDETTGLGYLAARDSATRQRDPNFDTLLDYPRLLALIDHIACPEILLIVDACHAGSLSSTCAGEGDAGRVRRFLTSGGNEYVPDGDPSRHSPFMAQLLLSLDLGDGGGIDLDRIARAMSGLTPRPRWGRFGSDAGGAGFSFHARSDGSGRLVTAASEDRSHGAMRGAPASTSSVSQDGLRATPKAVDVRELRRRYRRLDLHDLEWNREGDFPNELRLQTGALWDVVLDLGSGLVWQQAGSDRRLSRLEADHYVAELNRERHAGHADWRLPTLEELASLLESMPLSEGEIHIDPLFDPEQETCWSADRDRESGEPFYVSFATRRTVLGYAGRTAFVRAVRTP